MSSHAGAAIISGAEKIPPESRTQRRGGITATSGVDEMQLRD